MKWLDNRAFTLPINYCLCIGEDEARKVLKRLKTPNLKDFKCLSDNADATVTYLDNNEVHAAVAIVTCNEATFESASEIQIYGVLIHEAVHIWQEVCRLLGEDEPSAEFEAYSIQTISQNLIYSYKEQRDKLEKSKTQ